MTSLIYGGTTSNLEHLSLMMGKVYRDVSFSVKYACYFDFVLFWLGIWYESIVWVVMGRPGVFSECRRSSCSSYTPPPASTMLKGGYTGSTLLMLELVTFSTPSQYLNQDDYLSVRSHPLGAASIEFESKFWHFCTRKCIWKCCLQNNSHFVEASMSPNHHYVMLLILC